MRKVSFSFKVVKSLNVGRMYSETNSLQRLLKEIRYYLFKDIYIDIDIENALFTFLYRFAKGYFLKSPV